LRGTAHLATSPPCQLSTYDAHISIFILYFPPPVSVSSFDDQLVFYGNDRIRPAQFGTIWLQPLHAALGRHFTPE
jgi:hypothetical protein